MNRDRVPSRSNAHGVRLGVRLWAAGGGSISPVAMRSAQFFPVAALSLLVHLSLCARPAQGDPTDAVEAQTERAHKPRLIVLCAASVSAVVEEVAGEFTRGHDADVSVSAGASGALRRQIESGVPCDVFLSADPRQVDALVDAGRCVATSRRVVARNALALAVASGQWAPALAQEELTPWLGTVEAATRRTDERCPTPGFEHRSRRRAGTTGRLVRGPIQARPGR